MNILTIDTTTSDMVVLLVRDNDVVDGSVYNSGTHHSETLCNAVQQLLARADITFADLDAYACAVGPGSFTGIRIGVATVKGYCTACRKPYIAVNCLQAAGESAQLGAGHKAMIDAGNGYYFADYANDVQPCLVPYDFAEANPDVPVSAVASDRLDGIVTLVRAKFTAGEFDSDLQPLYIRKSQAEELRK